MKIVLPLFVLLCAATCFAVPLSVNVVDDKGKPVAGADVQLESLGKSPRGFVLHQTDGQGTTTFEVEPIPNSPFGDLAGRVFARKKQLAIGAGQLRFKALTPLSITLAAPAKISGTIVDGDDKPIPGASVSFLCAQKADGHWPDMLTDGPLLEQMTAHSDADGKWQLEDVPSDVQIYLRASAPNWVRQRTQLLSGGTGKIVMSPGAQIKGRLLGPDGKPLAGVTVVAQPSIPTRDSQAGSTKTVEDGTFTIDGITPGNFYLAFNAEEESPFVIGSVPTVKASVGVPVQLPDVRAVEGVVISGHVLEGATKAPVPGVRVGVYSGPDPASVSASSSAITDENGVWKMRTLPGENVVYLAGNPREFKPGSQEKKSVVSATGATDLDFALERLPKITGSLLDENGKPVKSYINLRRDNEIFQAASDDTGNFVIYGPTQGDWEATSFDWNIVGGTRLTVDPATPLIVRLKPIKRAALEVGVYDEDDAAVEGARVIASVLTGEGDNQFAQPREFISDKNGRAHLDNLKDDEKVISVSAKKPGYDSTAPATPARAGQVWSVAVTLLKRTGHASGQVFDDNGVVVAGARVSGSRLDTRTDEAGHFELTPLPKGITSVLALHDRGFVLSSSDKTRLDLKPQTLEPTDPQKAGKILDSLFDQARAVDYDGRDSLQFEVGSFEEIAQKLQQKPAPYAVSMLILRFGSDPTIPSARWFDVFQQTISSQSRLLNMAEWLQRVPTLAADEDARRFLQTLKQDVAEVEPRIKDDYNWQIAQGLFAVAAFADKIGDTKSADDLFERARVFTGNAFGRQSDGTFGSIGKIIASSPRLFLKAAALLPGTNSQRAILLGQGAPVLARTIGLQGVKPFLLQLQTAPPPKPDSNGNTFSTEAQWFDATIGSIRVAGKADPGLALELAKSLPAIPKDSAPDSRDTALCEAAFFQSPETARALWSASLPRLSPDKAMRLLVRILKSDEPFARTHYEILARDADTRPLPEYDVNYYEPNNIAAFAFYEARFNPARARFRLERALANAQSQATASSIEALASLCKAMAIFDADRAVGLTASLPGGINDWSGNFATRRRIAQWLALSEQARQHTGFSAESSQDWNLGAP